MLFNVERDEGSRIVGYLVPDDFSGVPSVRVTEGDKELLVFPCNEDRPALVAAGRHATGRCGFTVDETMIEGLMQKERLELSDNETKLSIYRRRPAAQILQKRVFRLETHLFPLWHLDEQISRRFQHFHKGIERHGRETTTQLFLLNNATSVYLSGRLIFKAYENYASENYACVALLRDPYTELAERLLTLKHARKIGHDLLGARDLMAYDAAIAFAETIENDARALRRAFGMMPKMAVANFANPLTRQLAARTADEAPQKGALAAALEVLSSFAVVGLREDQDFFLEEFANLLGVDPQALPEIPEFAQTAELSANLKQLPEAEVLVEQDLEIYQQVKSVMTSALDEGK